MTSPFELVPHLTDAHECDSDVEHLDSDELRCLHTFLHNGRAVERKADHDHPGGLILLTSRRLANYTHDRSRLTPRQRRRAVHKANRLDATARVVALAAIAALVAGCGAVGGGQVTGSHAVAAPPTRLARDPIGHHGAPQLAVAPAPPVTLSSPPAAGRHHERLVTAPPAGGDFWRRLANCESPSGRSGRYVGYFQFSADTAAKVGIDGSEDYETQRAAAESWSHQVNPSSTAGWPRCWAVARG